MTIHPESQAQFKLCELCEASRWYNTHHLTPKSQAGRNFDHTGKTIKVCELCHKILHLWFDNRTLAKNMSTLEDLRFMMAGWIEFRKAYPGYDPTHSKEALFRDLKKFSGRKSVTHSIIYTSLMGDTPHVGPNIGELLNGGA